MSRQQTQSTAKAYCTRWVLIFSMLFATCFVTVSACYELANADVLYKESIWLDLLYVARDICRSLFLSVICGFLLYGIYRLRGKDLVGMFLATLESLVFLSLINLFSYILLNAAWSPSTILELAGAILLETFFEALFLSVFALLCYLILHSAKKCGTTYIPYSSPLSFRNPIQVCALVGAALTFLPTLVENISFDIYYGAPTDLGDWLGLLLYYLIDTLICLVLPYVAMLLVCKKAEAAYQK